MNRALRMLVVDDDFTSRKILTRFLQPYGTVDAATSGVEAVEAIRNSLREGERYDLICLDILMPVMDGHATQNEIRKMETEKGIVSGDGAKIIMTTCVDDAKTIMQAFRDQCEAYLVKPITKEALLKELKSLGLIAS
jgi:two-component system, chemotaxis family, chemotaxis protein CheY